MLLPNHTQRIVFHVSIIIFITTIVIVVAKLFIGARAIRDRSVLRSQLDMANQRIKKLERDAQFEVVPARPEIGRVIQNQHNVPHVHFYVDPANLRELTPAEVKAQKNETSRESNRQIDDNGNEGERDHE